MITKFRTFIVFLATGFFVPSLETKLPFNDSDTFDLRERSTKLALCSTKHKEGGGCCPRIGTYCNCAGNFKDAQCCPGCCRFECHQGKFRCMDQCGSEVDPPCTSWGWNGNGFCPAEGTPCRCKNYFIDPKCCSTVGFCRFRCVDGLWRREEKCNQCSANMEICPLPGTDCSCFGSFTNNDCCPKTKHNTFTCLKGKWVLSNVCPDYQMKCSELIGCKTVGSRCDCVGNTNVDFGCCKFGVGKTTFEPSVEPITTGCSSYRCNNGIWQCASGCTIG